MEEVRRQGARFRGAHESEVAARWHVCRPNPGLRTPDSGRRANPQLTTHHSRISEAQAPLGTSDSMTCRRAA